MMRIIDINKTGVVCTFIKLRSFEFVANSHNNLKFIVMSVIIDTSHIKVWQMAKDPRH